MRNLLNKFRKSESGASLVEYAVALIVVTIVGGAGKKADVEGRCNQIRAQIEETSSDYDREMNPLF